MKASWKLRVVPSLAATIQLLKSISTPHYGGLVIGPYLTLFDVPFVSMMALKALRASQYQSFFPSTIFN